MPIKIVEFKARVKDAVGAEEKFLSLQPSFKGEDRQTDTYFNVASGRLKLREGNIENALIWYDRPDDAGSKLSNVLLYRHAPDASLKDVLTNANGIKVVVTKRRRIYFIDNVKFHFDEVEDLGRFIEVEAIDESAEPNLEKIRQQCDHYAKFFAIEPQEFISLSYSDLLLKSK
jgi:adenylate cyclase, class 2